MTETAALLRALHCDLVATNGIIAALLDDSGNTPSQYDETITLAIQNASVYYGLADKLAEEDGEL